MNITAIIGAILGIADKAIPDADAREKFKAEFTTQILSNESDLHKATAQIITAEAQGESALQRNWRPITMLVFVFIIANNYVIAPYAMALIGWHVPTLDIPQGMWGLLQLGIGGYIASRGGEKIAATMARK